ncbi:pyrimidine reductase family protein [Streptomyces calidiresistens]|uniref:Pyrimidine reductase family protein n=1 Tax=Streptomyces calidiresistens TaxID=1485586 RepID=A0A7W3XZE3_9ACTN|nr:pyrimidine reductase family protein [Streptomyces calidiresistens]MBB0232959.1 pyrimidine reductase family protein [Streptomyces calidiresistens]
MRRLLPPPTGDDGTNGSPGPGGPDGKQWSLTDLAAAYAYPDPLPAEGWLRANMVTSLDGAGHHEGRSQPLSSSADMRIFGVLRALADVIVVGAGTVRSEGYRPARRREEFAAARAAAGQGPAAAIAVVSAGLDLDFSLPLFTEPLVPTLVVTGEAAPPERLAAARAAGARVVFAGDGAGVEPARVRAELAALGHRRQLTEGGPGLLGRFVTAGALDELCLTISPRMTAGTAGRIAYDGTPLEVPRELEPVSILEEDGFLFTRYAARSLGR